MEERIQDKPKPRLREDEDRAAWSTKNTDLRHGIVWHGDNKNEPTRQGESQDLKTLGRHRSTQSGQGS